MEASLAQLAERRQLATAVRLARPRDAEALTTLVNRAYEIEADFVTGDRTTVAEIAALIDNGAFLVLDGQGLPLTGSTAEWRRGVVEHGNSHTLAAAVHVDTRGGAAAFIRMLSVLPELQGSGLGRRLLGIGEAMCEASGCTSVRLQIVNLREELSRWYRGLGYRVVGTSPFETRDKLKPCHFVDLRKDLRHVTVAPAAA